MQIQSVEPVVLAAKEGISQFDAFGSHFRMSLQDNHRLLQSLAGAQKARLSRTRLLRGRLDGVAGSWVRLTQVGSGLEGAIWDGRELYVVTRYGQVSRWLARPLDVSPEQTVTYRLSDAANILPEQYCGSETPLPRSKRGGPDAVGSMLQRFRNTVADLKSGLVTGAAPLQLDLSLLADPAFQGQFGADSTDAMLARLNIVDGIFTEQVGVLLSPTEFRLLPAGADPLTSTDAEDLLAQLADYREGDDALRSSGLTHLMTGKLLDGTIAGIGYTGGLCDTRMSASLSDSSNGTFLSALVMAHELGHNFGAPHDGAAGGACESTPNTFLMAPVLGNHPRFSQCSLDEMLPFVTRARDMCLTQPAYADVSIELPPSPFTVDTRGTFSVPVNVLNRGNLVATAAMLELDLPPTQLAFESAVLDGGSCSLSGNMVSCTLGDMAPGEHRQVELRLTGTTLGPFDLQARVTAGNDRIATNNTASVEVGLAAGVELGLSVAVTPQGPVYVGDAIDVTVDVLSRRAQATAGATLQLSLGGIPIESVSAGAHVCTLDVADGSLLNCQLADIPGNSATRVVLRGRPDLPGDHDAQFSITATNGATPISFSTSTRIEVIPEAEVRTSVSTENLEVIVDTPAEITYTLAAFGRLPSTAVTFSVGPPANGSIEAVTSNSATCTVPASPAPAVCVVGNLNPGETRDIQVRVRTNSSGSSTLAGRSRYLNGANEETTQASVAINSLWRVDTSLLLSGAFDVAIGQSTTAIVSYQSLGADAAQDVVITVDLPPPARFTGLTTFPSSSVFICSIVSPQQGRCTGFFLAGAPPLSGVAAFTFVSDAALDGQVTANITADDDADAGNNSATAPLRVQGQQLLTDLQLSIAAGNASTVRGSRLRFPLITVTNGAAPARNVVVEIPIPGFATVETVSSSALCSGTTTLQCSWSSLLPGESVTIDLYLVDTAAGSFTSQVVARADNDSNAGNNSRAVTVSFTTPSSGGGGGGSSGGGGRKKGGGALELWSLAALAMLLARRKRRDVRKESA